MAKITEAGPSHTPGEEPEGWGQPGGQAELEEDEATGGEEPGTEGDVSPDGRDDGGSADSDSQVDEGSRGGAAGTGGLIRSGESESRGDVF